MPPQSVFSFSFCLTTIILLASCRTGLGNAVYRQSSRPCRYSTSTNCDEVFPNGATSGKLKSSNQYLLDRMLSGKSNAFMPGRHSLLPERTGEFSTLVKSGRPDHFTRRESVNFQEGVPRMRTRRAAELGKSQNHKISSINDVDDDDLKRHSISKRQTGKNLYEYLSQKPSVHRELNDVMPSGRSEKLDKLLRSLEYLKRLQELSHRQQEELEDKHYALDDLPNKAAVAKKGNWENIDMHVWG